MNGEAASKLTILKFILCAMALGIVSLVAVFLAIKPPTGALPADEGHQILLAVLGMLAVSELPAYLVVRTVTKSQVRQKIAAAGGADDRNGADAVDLPGAYCTLTIVSAALAEAWGLFGAVVYLISGAWLALIAPVIAIGVVLGLLPTQYKYDCFVEEVTRKQVL